MLDPHACPLFIELFSVAGRSMPSLDMQLVYLIDSGHRLSRTCQRIVTSRFYAVRVFGQAKDSPGY